MLHLLKNVFIYMYVYTHTTYAGILQSQKALDSSGAGVTESCELFNMGPKTKLRSSRRAVEVLTAEASLQP